MEPIQQRQAYSVNNQRRVLKSLKKITDSKQNSYLLGSDCMFGSSFMDGKMKLFTLKNLTDSVNKDLIQSHFVESSYCVVDSEYFMLGQDKEFIVTGFDDGSFHVYDYSFKKNESYQRPTFKVSKDKPSSVDDLESTNTIFKESMFEHSDSITCIERNFKDKTKFLTAGKDSLLNVWKFSDNDLVEFVYDINQDTLRKEGIMQTGAINKAKWLEEEVVVMALNDGTVQFKDLRAKKEESAGLLIPKVGSAVLDLALWKHSSGVKVIIAEDSGKIRLIDPKNNKESIVLAEGIRESALTLSVDHINQTQETFLSIGYQQSISVLDLNNQQNQKFSIKPTKDNVSCIKTLYDNTQSQIITVFGTYDGKINFTYL